MHSNNHNKKHTEIDLLILCATKEMSVEQSQRLQEIIASEIRWDIFINLVFLHGVATLVYRNLNQCCSPHVPTEILSKLRHHFIINAQTNLSLFKELLNSTALLEQHDISCIPFKGLISAELIYKDLSLRKCGDIDILVRETDFKRAKQLFINEGFYQTLSDRAEIDYLQSGLFNKTRQLSIDLHYGIPPKQISTFSTIDMFLVICINATKEYWGQRLYQYCDINEFLLAYKELDFNKVINRAKELRCKRMLYTALLVTKEIFNTPIPSNVLTLIDSYSPVHPVKDELLKQIFPDDINYQGIRQKLFVLKSEQNFFMRLTDKFFTRMLFYVPKTLAPNKNDFAALDLPTSWHALYFLLKPVRVLITRTSKNIKFLFRIKD